MPILLVDMGRDDHPVRLFLTSEEAEELLSRCLNSEERDTPVFQQALLKLAKASFKSSRAAGLSDEGGPAFTEDAA